MTPLQLVEKALIDSGYIKIDDYTHVEENSNTYAITSSKDDYTFLWYNDECIMFSARTGKIC